MTLERPSVTEKPHAARSWIAIAALVGIAVVGSLLLHGYRFGESDHFEQLPQIRRQLDPGYLARDWFVNATADFGSPRYAYSLLMAAVVRMLGEPTAFFVTYIASLTILASSVGLWTLRRFGSLPAAYVAAFLSVTLSGGTLGGSNIVVPLLLPSLLAWALIAAGFAAFDHHRWLLGGVLFGVCTLIHPLLGPEVFALSVVWILLRQRSLRPIALAAAGFVVLGLAGLAPVLGSQATDVGGAEQISILAHQRHPWHYVPSSWPPLEWHPFIGLLTAVSLRIKLDRRIRDFQWLIGGLLGALLLGALFTEVIPVAAAVKAQVFRLTVLLQLLGAVVLGGWIGEQWAMGPRRLVGVSAFVLILAAIFVDPSLFLVLAVLIATVSFRLTGRLVDRGTIMAVVVVIVGGSLLAITLTGNRIDLRLLTAIGLSFAGLLMSSSLTGPRSGGRAWLMPTAVLFAVVLTLGGITEAAMGDGYPPRVRPWVAPVRGTLTYSGPLDEIASWARTSTSRDSVFVVPPHYFGFRVKADRAIVVDFKAFAFRPSDMVEWRHRLESITGQAPLVLGYGYYTELSDAYAVQPLDELAAAARQFGADYIIVPANKTTEVGRVFETDGWAVIESASISKVLLGSAWPIYAWPI